MGTLATAQPIKHNLSVFSIVTQLFTLLVGTLLFIGIRIKLVYRSKESTL
jgi:hypothetical protein